MACKACGEIDTKCVCTYRRRCAAEIVDQVLRRAAARDGDLMQWELEALVVDVDTYLEGRDFT